MSNRRDVYHFTDRRQGLSTGLYAKQRRIMKRLVTLISLVLIFYCHAPSHADTVTLVADEWCPFNCVPGSEEPGYIVEISRRIFEKAGHTLVYRVLPWKRAIIMSREGAYTGIIGASPEEAGDFIFPEEEFGQLANDFFVRKGNPWRFGGMDSLQSIKLGIIQGYDYTPIFNEYIRQNPDKVDTVSGEEPIWTNLKKLVNGRFDVMLSQRDIVRHKAKKMGLADAIEFAGTDKVYDPIYIAFSPAIPKSAEYAALLDKGVREMRASGELAGILDRYGLTDWKEEAMKAGSMNGDSKKQ